MHFQDPIYSGGAGVTVGGETRSPLLKPVNLPSVVTPGAPVQNASYFSVVPLTMQANNIVTSAVVNGAATLTAGTGVTTTVYNDTTYLTLDTPRCIRITGVSGTSAVNFTIVGLDEYYQPMSQVILGPAGATTVTTTKAFKFVSSITSAATTTNAVTIGTSDVLGLPFRVDEFGQLVGAFYNTAVLTATTGFTAAVTSTASTSTGDVRGTYALQSASDGTKRFTALIVIKDASRMDTVVGVAQA